MNKLGNWLMCVELYRQDLSEYFNLMIISVISVRSRTVKCDGQKIPVYPYRRKPKNFCEIRLSCRSWGASYCRLQRCLRGN